MERQDEIDRRDARRAVEQQSPKVQNRQRDPQHRRVLVQRTQGAVAAEPVKDRSPERDPGDQRDRERAI